jgi:arylsulfatase A-like enzyme
VTPEHRLGQIATALEVVVALVLLVTSAIGGSAAEAAPRPNILVLLTDDQRWDAMGCAGSPIVRTPEMDRLAAEGTRFVNAFVTSSICAASRASIFTGQYERAHRCNFHTGCLRRAQLEQSYPMLVRKAGYYTGFIGKYGVEYAPPGKPPRDVEGREVFDRWYGFYGQGVYFPKEYPGKHLNQVMVDQARDFLATAPRDKPWCLSISFKAPHSGEGYVGYHAEPDLKGIYADAVVPYPPTAGREFFDALPPFLRKCNARTNYWELRFSTPERYQATMKDYYRLVTGVDRAIGQIRGELAARGLSENTVIVFLSDNGDMHGDYQLGGKELLYDASIRIPLVIFDPRVPKSARGQRRSELVLNLDVAPSVLDAAGVAVPAAMQGRSALPLVRSERVGWREEFFCENHFAVPEQYYPLIEGVRTARWKYVRYPEMTPVYEQLFDLERDPLEAGDLARNPQCREVLSLLRNRCDQLRAEAGHGS